MKKIITLTISFLSFINIYTYSQNTCKMNFGTSLAANNTSQRDKHITLLVKGNISEIQKYVIQSEGKFINAIGNIASVTLPARNIKELASMHFVNRIETRNPHSKLKPLHDSMLVHNQVLPVHAGTPPLLQAYKGDNVVIGIIDTGIDFTHPDFRTSGGRTRIKFLWDQSLSTSNPPMPYNYGREYDSAAIDNNLATLHLDSTARLYAGHGTHVASEAVGNGLAVNNYKGVAPNADIIFVAVDFDNLNAIIDATKYIYTKAALLGKPCVINCSLGDDYGSHDGKDLQAQAIKTLITAQSGRSFVAAAGNSGNNAFHLGYTVSAIDTNFTWFTGPAYIAMYGDTNNFKNIQFAIGADKPGPNYSFRGRTTFSTITPNLGVLLEDTIWNGTNRLCTMLTYGDLVNGVYSMEFAIDPDSSYNWRLITTGTGKFDEWSYDVITANLGDTTIYPALKKYKQPDFNSTIVSSFQCLNEVITVGNYINRNQHVDVNASPQSTPSLIPGSLHASSGRGPTRDGRIKPDISAPGQYQMGSIVLSLVYPSSSLAVGGKHRIGNGTSASSPTVAGIAALFLQSDPSAGWLDVKNGIINCARKDSFTGSSLPNNLWGYGKADAFATLTGCSTTDISNSLTSLEEFTIYPNPFHFETTLEINISAKTQNASLKIYDIIGQELKSFSIHNSEKLLIGRNALPAGIYFCTLSNGGKTVCTKKMIVTD